MNDDDCRSTFSESCAHALAPNQLFVQLTNVDTYHALIERSDPNDVHERVSVEAVSLSEAKRLLENRFGQGKVVSIFGDRESRHIR